MNLIFRTFAGTALAIALFPASLRASPAVSESELHETHRTGRTIQLNSTDCITRSAENDNPNNTECFKQLHIQKIDTTYSKLDLIFVIDTSGSLYEERKNIVTNIGEFIAGLPPGIDLRVALILGHSSKSSYSGQLYVNPKAGPEAYLSTKKFTIKQIRNRLAYLMESMPTDKYADGGEELLYSFSKFIDNTLKIKKERRPIFRQDAAAATIFIGDENDICYPGYVKDGDNIEKPAYQRDCKGINAASVKQKMNKVMEGRPYLLNGIVYTSWNTMPRDGENEPGWGVIETVSLVKGVLVDMAKRNFATGMRKIGEISAVKFGLTTEFMIPEGAREPKSVWVKVDGKKVAFDLTGNKITLNPAHAGRDGSTVEIHYCIKGSGPSPEPSASPSVTPSPSPTVTPSPGPSVTPSPSPTVTPSPEPSASPSVTPSPSPSPTPPCTNPFVCNGGIGV